MPGMTVYFLHTGTREVIEFVVTDLIVDYIGRYWAQHDAALCLCYSTREAVQAAGATGSPEGAGE